MQGFTGKQFWEVRSREELALSLELEAVESFATAAWVAKLCPAPVSYYGVNPSPGIRYGLPEPSSECKILISYLQYLPTQLMFDFLADLKKAKWAPDALLEVAFDLALRKGVFRELRERFSDFFPNQFSIHTPLPYVLQGNVAQSYSRIIDFLHSKGVAMGHYIKFQVGKHNGNDFWAKGLDTTLIKYFTYFNSEAATSEDAADFVIYFHELFNSHFVKGVLVLDFTWLVYKHQLDARYYPTCYLTQCGFLYHNAHKLISINPELYLQLILNKIKHVPDQQCTNDNDWTLPVEAARTLWLLQALIDDKLLNPNIDLRAFGYANLLDYIVSIPKADVQSWAKFAQLIDLLLKNGAVITGEVKMSLIKDSKTASPEAKEVLQKLYALNPDFYRDQVAEMLTKLKDGHDLESKGEECLSVIRDNVAYGYKLDKSQQEVLLNLLESCAYASATLIMEIMLEDVAEGLAAYDLHRLFANTANQAQAFAVAEVLLKNGANAGTCNAHGSSLIAEAINSHKTEWVKMLAPYSAPEMLSYCNQPESRQAKAVKQGDIDYLELLLVSEGGVNKLHGATTLAQLAIGSPHSVMILSALHKHGADFTYCDQEGHSIYYNALLHGDANAAAFLTAQNVPLSCIAYEE